MELRDKDSWRKTLNQLPFFEAYKRDFCINIKIQPLERNAQTFLDVVDFHKGIIYKISRAYCRKEADRQDLVQEILLQLWFSFKKYDEQFALSTWIYRIALNVSISYLVGILWVGFVDLLIINSFPYASPFFLVSTGIQVLLTKLAIGIYFYQLILIYQADVGEPVIDTQEKFGPQCGYD